MSVGGVAGLLTREKGCFSGHGMFLSHSSNTQLLQYEDWVAWDSPAVLLP